MKKFTFNLGKVLDLRRHAEEEAKNELGRVTGILNEIENRIRKNAAAMSAAGRQRFSDISGASMFTWDAYILRLEREALLLTEEAAKAELAVEEKRILYIDASRELKVMEKLREKRAGEYRKRMFTAQTLELDDAWNGRRSAQPAGDANLA